MKNDEIIINLVLGVSLLLGVILEYKGVGYFLDGIDNYMRNVPLFLYLSSALGIFYPIALAIKHIIKNREVNKWKLQYL